MSELLAPLRERYFISGEINSEVADQDAQDAGDRRALLATARSTGSTASRSTTTDWHFNVRPSNTEPLLRLNLESLVSPEHMAEKRDEVLALIRA